MVANEIIWTKLKKGMYNFMYGIYQEMSAVSSMYVPGEIFIAGMLDPSDIPPVSFLRAWCLQQSVAMYIHSIPVKIAK